MGTKQDRFTRMLNKHCPDVLPTLDAIAKRTREQREASRTEDAQTSPNWREQAEEIGRRVRAETIERQRINQIARDREIELGASQLRAMSEDERWNRYAQADRARADRLSNMTPHQIEDKERQRQGEFTNDAANYDEAREAEGHR